MAEPTRRKKYDTKRCPECFTHLPVHVTVCTSCNQKVGEPDGTGMTKKPVDWLSYITALLAVGALGFFVWYFFPKK